MPRKLINHKPPRLNIPAFNHRPTAAKRGYDRTWRKYRAWYLGVHPLCVLCQERGSLTPATEVDHIVRLEDGGERLDPANTRALCKPCHSAHTWHTTRGNLRGIGDTPNTPYPA